uniref:Uncharacterized protein n=1 Tax=Caenorhabditis japonica TaxID=281687 RepID=A0A8R1DU20_CAEJA
MASHIVRFLLLTTLLLAKVGALQDFSISFQANKDCDAGANPVVSTKCANGYRCISNGKYQVTHANIYFVDPKGKINGIVVCTVADNKCTNSIGQETGTPYIMLVVTLDRSSSEDQNIHYMYSDELFGLSKLPAPGKPKDLHLINNFLFVKSAKYGSSEFSVPDCKKNRARSLISGHGYFVAKMTAGVTSWDSMYYLPERVGQYMFTP